ncbi:MAG: hypothetical protein QM760_00790 [Nibricoccus sp.]
MKIKYVSNKLLQNENRCDLPDSNVQRLQLDLADGTRLDLNDICTAFAQNAGRGAMRAALSNKVINLPGIPPEFPVCRRAQQFSGTMSVFTLRVRFTHLERTDPESHHILRAGPKAVCIRRAGSTRSA